MQRNLVLVLLAIMAASAARAAPPSRPPGTEAAACTAAINAAERASRLPPKLLGAIGLVESGRPDPVRRVVEPWPWTVNVAGAGHFYGSKADAVAAVRDFEAAGAQSIDVGCMQVSLLYHPAAFSSLDEAFDPQTNAAYAASFLKSLYQEMSSWPQAAASYHSRTPDLAADYGRRVMAAWPLAARYGGADLAWPTRLQLAQAQIAQARQARLAQIDPYRVYTPEFRARLAADAAERAARDAAMLGRSRREPGTARKLAAATPR